MHRALKLINQLINIYQGITQQKAGLTLSMSSFSILSPLSSLSRDLILELISRRKRNNSQLQLQLSSVVHKVLVKLSFLSIGNFRRLLEPKLTI